MQCFNKLIVKSIFGLVKIRVTGVDLKSQTNLKSLSTGSRNIVMKTTNLSNNSDPRKRKVELLPLPVKGETDTKEYRTIRLENGLTVCLISDIRPNEDAVSALSTQNDSDDDVDDDGSDEDVEEEAEDEEMKEKDLNEGECDDNGDAPKSVKASAEAKQKMGACALCVSVGSFHDPLQVPGLAHFLEHMVFMGSAKFPSENHFDSYISQRGGEDNASTDYEYTTFYFECLERYLLPAMDKFAQFFISPLMKRNSMQREREAVESEFQAALPSDTHRMEQILSNLLCEEGGVNRFSWGNMRTLKGELTDDELYDRLHNFRKLHYSAHRMTVAVQSRLPLDTLEQYIINCFSDVPNNNLPPPNLSTLHPNITIHPRHLFNRIYYIRPVQACHRIDLSFSLPPLQRYYRQKPLEYIGWLLGGEGKGSALALLKANNWALSIEAGCGGEGVEDNQLYTLLRGSVVLTEEGLDHWQEVVEVLMGYIELVKRKGPQEWLHREMAQIADVRFRFAEQDEPSDNVEHLVEFMHLYQPEDYLTGSELHLEYCPETLKMVLTYLRPDNLNIMISTNKDIAGVVYNEEEKWFQTKYCVRDIPIEWLNRWTSVEPNPALSMPLPNNFLTTDFTLINEEHKRAKRNVRDVLLPKMIIESPSIELWFKPDTQFYTPHASYTFYLMNPLCVESAENYCMLEILREMLHHELNEETYPAILADLLYEFCLSDVGLQLKLFGYSQKLLELLELVSKYLRAFPDKMNPVLFKSIKEQQKYNYFNRIIKPSKMSNDIRLSILMPAFYTSLEKYKIIESVTFDKLREFSSAYLDRLYIQGLICGNVQEEAAIVIGQKLVEILQFTPIPKQFVQKKEVKQLPKGVRCCRVKSLNPDETNTHITHYFQNGPGNLKDSVYIQLLMFIIEEPLFDTLRTKEELGYNIYSLLRDTQSILGMSITVQTRTNRATPNQVDLRIAAFIAKVTAKLLGKMPEKRFQQIKRDLIKLKQCEDTYLREEVNILWDEIETGQYMFDRKEREVERIEGVGLGELRKFWSGLIGTGVDGNGCKQLTVQVVGQKVVNNLIARKTEEVISTAETRLDLEFLGREDEEENRGDGYFICDIDAFKTGLVSFIQRERRELNQSLKQHN